MEKISDLKKQPDEVKEQFSRQVAIVFSVLLFIAWASFSAVSNKEKAQNIVNTGKKNIANTIEAIKPIDFNYQKSIDYETEPDIKIDDKLIDEATKNFLKVNIKKDGEVIVK